MSRRIDLDVLILKLRHAAKTYGEIRRSNPLGSDLLPPEDATAARVLRAIADAVDTASQPPVRRRGSRGAK